MSAESIRRIFASFEPRITKIDQVDVADRLETGTALLTEYVTAIARAVAESTFLTAQTTPGLTQEGAQRLADEVMFQHGLIITELAHNVGGTLDLALSLTGAASIAYGTRLAELSTSSAYGGAA